MEKEMYELEKKNAELQQHHAEDSNSATPQPVGGEEQDKEMQPSSRGEQRERKKNQNAVDQKPRKNRTSKRMDKKLKEIIEKLEQRCDLLTEVAQHQHNESTSRAGDLLQKSASPFTDRVASFRLPEKFKVPDIKTYTG
jgi:phosphatidate phosphatase PAH1